MQDRVPTYPGRIKLTPVSGQENTYDMVRADEPTQEGTPLNKASLLQDETAALYGKGADAVPNDILSILSNAVLSIDGNLQDIGGSKVGIRIATGSYAGAGTYGASNPCSLTFDFAPKLVIIWSKSATLSAVSYLNGYWGFMIIPYGVLKINADFRDSSTLLANSFTWSKTKMSWYSTANAKTQYNESGKTYGYIAIG